MRSLIWTALIALLAACGAEPSRTSHDQPQLTADGTNSQMTPEETVRKLVRAYLDKRLGEYYDLVAAIDKEAKSLASLQQDFAPSSSDLVTDYIFKFTSFHIDSTSVDGDSALVYVTSESPSLRYVMREASVVERSLGPDADLLTKLSLLNERMRLGGGRRVENQTVYFLVREPKGWRAVVGWADEKAFEEQMRADSAQTGGT